MTIHTGLAGGPYYLVVGQGYDRRWRATMDGRPLGPPLLLDGYSLGWRIDDQRPHRFEVAFGPQRIAGWSFAASAAGLALVVVLLSGWRPGRARSRRGVRPDGPHGRRT
jgi:arabinofuranan 3-O-arabinosyltransferase